LRRPLIVVRGGGDLATGVAHRLRRAGFPVVVTELAQPLVVRRSVAFASAVFDGEIEVEGLVALRIEGERAAAEARDMARAGQVPVVVDPDGRLIAALSPGVVVDARLAKRPLDTTLGQAPLVIGLGPGFIAGVHCHAVVETQRGHDLGRVLWHGAAEADTGEPEAVLGHTHARVLRAPVDGVFEGVRVIGDLVQADDVVGCVDTTWIAAPFMGVVRGLIHNGLAVRAGAKVGDIDPRPDPARCFTISDKARAVGGGVLEAILSKF
jgi:xanthine dehydrogenase accessory factor